MLPSKEILIFELLYQCKTNIQVAEKYNVHPMTVSRWCKRYGIRRDLKYLFKLTPQFLENQLIIKNKSIRKLAQELKIQSSTVYEYALRYNIKISKSRSAQKQSELEAILNDSIRDWKKWKLFRKDILIRDKYKCQNCGKKAKAIHHIRPRKIFPELCWQKKNVISICNSCHIKLDKIIQRRWK